VRPISASCREFLRVAGGLAMAGTSIGVPRGDAQQVPYTIGTEPPKPKASANACDCHMHIYDAKYPKAEVDVV
jgi:hypothetical protein